MRFITGTLWILNLKTILALSLEQCPDCPTFNINHEKSMSAIPSIAMTFPNGITDHLILNQHNDECNYLGHLEKDQDVCVAMTGCLGQDHVEFTILSKAFENPHFLWHKDGSVEQLRTVNERYGLESKFIETDRDEDLTAKDKQTPPDANEEDFLKKENNFIVPPIPEDCRAGACDDLITQRTHLMKMKVMYDNNLIKRFGTQDFAEKKLKEMLTHTQALFCEKTLGSRFHIEATLQHVNRTIQFHATPEGWGETGKHHKTDPDRISEAYSVYAYFGGSTADAEFGGIAFCSVTCTGTSTKQSLNIYWDHAGIAAHILAHETGHNMGIAHNRKPECKGIMSGWGSGWYAWSECNREDFEGHLVKKVGVDNWCMAEKPDACMIKQDSQCPCWDNSPRGSDGSCPRDEPDKNFKLVGCYQDGQEGPYKGVPKTATWTQNLRYGFPYGASPHQCYNEIINWEQVKGNTWKYFALNHGTTCYVGNDLSKFGGTVSGCQCGRGNLNQVSIYEVKTKREPDFDHLGCFWDYPNRMFAKRISYDAWGMTPTKCYEWIQKNGGKAKYPIFGVQVATECWGGTPAELATFKTIHGDAKTGSCSHGRSVGMGTDWKNDVYEIRA